MKRKSTPKLATRQSGPDLALRMRAFVAEWSVLILLYLFGTTTLLQAFVVPTGSMEGTVLIGDHMIVDKLAYAKPGPVSQKLLPYQDVRRGDIVVFKYPLDVTVPYVKRVIGVPGDRLRLVNNKLILNGEPIDEPYVTHKSRVVSDYAANFPSAPPDASVYSRALKMLAENTSGDDLVVPADRYFAMGDNRDNSSDSRYWGFVPRENIIGKPLIVFWSYDAPTAELANPNFISLDHALDLAANFFAKTRWDRTFMLIRGYDIKNRQ